MAINIEELMLKEAFRKINLNEYLPQVEDAVHSYLESQEFQEAVAECLSDEGIGWDIGRQVAKQLAPAMKKLKIKVEL